MTAADSDVILSVVRWSFSHCSVVQSLETKYKSKESKNHNDIQVSSLSWGQFPSGQPSTLHMITLSFLST